MVSFAIIFYNVLALTLLAGAGATIVAFFGDRPLTQAQARLFDALIWIFVSGVMLFLVLLGAYLTFQPPHAYTDTGGFTDHVFAVSALVSHQAFAITPCHRAT